MSKMKSLMESDDEVIQTLTQQFLNEEMSWDEFFAQVTDRLQEIGEDDDVVGDYDRAMKGI